MERMNGEIRDREKVFRRLKTKDCPVLKGYQLYHNCVRPHESLNGKTPADACEIVVKRNGKWMTLIENATIRTRFLVFTALTFMIRQTYYFNDFWIINSVYQFQQIGVEIF